jgi:hypothetical protein
VNVNGKERGSVKGKENGSVRENAKFHPLFQVPVLQALSGNEPRNSYLLQYSDHVILIKTSNVPKVETLLILKRCGDVILHLGLLSFCTYSSSGIPNRTNVLDTGSLSYLCC